MTLKGMAWVTSKAQSNSKCLSLCGMILHLCTQRWPIGTKHSSKPLRGHRSWNNCSMHESRYRLKFQGSRIAAMRLPLKIH